MIKFANTSNRGRVCLFSQNEAAILFLQPVPFEFRQVYVSIACFDDGHLRLLFHPEKNQ